MAEHFTLKANDTRPIFEVTLKNPDGSVHDLTGSTAWKWHVKSSPVFIRDLVIQGDPTLGTLRYTGSAADWDTGNVNGFLPVPSASYPLSEYPMEYQVTGGSSILTFPNNGFDYLRITKDIA